MKTSRLKRDRFRTKRGCRPQSHNPSHVTMDSHKKRIDVVYAMSYDSHPWTIRGILFEWHPGKASSNEQKHGIDFETAAEVFFDPFVQVRDATGENWDHRGAVLGLTVDWRLLCVVYAERGNGIRIISARPATTAERKRYETQ